MGAEEPRRRHEKKGQKIGESWASEAGQGRAKSKLVLSMNKQMFRYTKLIEKRKQLD